MKRLLPLVLFAFLLLAPVAYAQDAPTPEATPAVVVVNVPGTTINVQPAETPVAPPVDTTAVGTFGLYLLLALVGGGSFALVLSRLDKRGLDALERAYQSTPPATQAAILEVLNVLTELVKVGHQVTDNQPNVEVSAQNATVNNNPPPSGSNSG